eukprot:6471675-Amphidinium_carterae.2
MLLRALCNGNMFCHPAQLQDRKSMASLSAGMQCSNSCKCLGVIPAQSLLPSCTKCTSLRTVVCARPCQRLQVQAIGVKCSPWMQDAVFTSVTTRSSAGATIGVQCSSWMQDAVFTIVSMHSSGLLSRSSSKGQVTRSKGYRAAAHRHKLLSQCSGK